MKNYREHLEEVLADPEQTAEYLTACLEEDNLEILETCLTDINGGEYGDFDAPETTTDLWAVKGALAQVGLRIKIEKAE